MDSRTKATYGLEPSGPLTRVRQISYGSQADGSCGPVPGFGCDFTLPGAPEGASRSWIGGGTASCDLAMGVLTVREALRSDPGLPTPVQGGLGRGTGSIVIASGLQGVRRRHIGRSRWCRKATNFTPRKRKRPPKEPFAKTRPGLFDRFATRRAPSRSADGRRRGPLPGGPRRRARVHPAPGP